MHHGTDSPISIDRPCGIPLRTRAERSKTSSRNVYSDGYFFWIYAVFSNSVKIPLITYFFERVFAAFKAIAFRRLADSLSALALRRMVVMRLGVLIIGYIQAALDEFAILAPQEAA